MKYGHYEVNGKDGPPVADTGGYRPVINVPPAPQQITVPENFYFIIQDSPTGGFDSHVLSWVKRKDIVSTRLWYLSDRGFFKTVE